MVFKLLSALLILSVVSSINARKNEATRFPGINVQPATSQLVDYILGLFNRLPPSLYNNFVCNVLVGSINSLRNPYYLGYPYTYYYYFGRRKRDTYGTYQLMLYSQAVQGAFQTLSPFWNKKDLNSLYNEARKVATDIMSKQMTQYLTATETSRRLLKNYLARHRHNLNVNDVYSAIFKLNSTPQKTFLSTVDYYVQSSCNVIRNEYQCNYLKRMTTSGVCSTYYFSNQMLNQCCGGNSTGGTFNTPSVPLPLPTAPIPVVTSQTTTPTTTIVTAPTTTVSSRTCGISKLNPAPRFLNFLTTMNELRIVGGVPTDKCEYPWIVRLSADDALCAGSIIDETHILTAGHCFSQSTRPQDVLVYAGDYNYDVKDTGEIQVPVSKIDIHPQYTDNGDGSVEFDMAVLTLREPLTFNDCIQPICLPNAGDSSKLSKTDCTVAGWGTTSFQGSTSPVLQEVTVPTYKGSDCKNVYTNSLPSNPATQICAGSPGSDSCQGDSGGPLFCPVNGQYVQYGIVSYGDGCAEAGNAAVYSDVSALVGFINSITGTSRQHNTLQSYLSYFMAKKFRPGR